MSPIHSLPVELLTTIFQLGVDSEPIPDDRIRGLHTFEVLVSHVCKFWRQVAIHTPHLWTTIHFRTLAHMGRGRVYLSRNPHLPFDIYIDTCSEEEYQNRKDLLFRNQFLPVFGLVLPQIHRWRELHLIVADLECKSYAREVLSTCGSAPVLRTLQLWHVQNWQTSERLFNHIGPPPVVVFDGSLPSLKHIILQGVNLPWARSPFLRNLTTVEFALHSDNVRMPFHLWRDMLDGSPNLIRLSLLFSGPRASPSGVSPLPDGIEWWGAEPPPADTVLPPGAHLPPSTDPVQLLQLKEVQLNNLESDYLIALFRTLHAPNVRSLHLGLDFDDQDFTPFVEYLAAPPQHPSVKINTRAGAPPSRAKFPALERLSVTALKCSLPSWRALLAASPCLTRLEADFGQLSAGAFDVLLEDSEDSPGANVAGVNGENSSGSRGVELIVPALETMRVWGVSGRQLATLAAARRASGRRVRRWEVDEAGRDAELDALLKEAAEASKAWREEREAEERSRGAVSEPWRWDEPLESVVLFKEEDAESDFGSSDGEVYSEEDVDAEQGESDEDGDG
ncbi:hypothetical protein BC628DRAFT_1330480 [Trametes gibbosa]|nr:hypothetical protein BC628DRAFT_1330480 [Trametes gibbosa]